MSKQLGLAIFSLLVFFGICDRWATAQTVLSTGSIPYAAGLNITTVVASGAYGPAVDSAGNLYVDQTGTLPYLAVDPSGTYVYSEATDVDNPNTVFQNGSAYAGAQNGTDYSFPCQAQNGSFFQGDGGSASSAYFNYPTGLAVDSGGNLYIADSCSGVIRRVGRLSGNISTVAGRYSSTGAHNLCCGFSGDGGPATNALMNTPVSVAVDSAGNQYIADKGNNRIRKVTASTGYISTIAGNGTAGFSGDGGAATSATLKSPSGVAVDSLGNVYIADTGNNRVRMISAATGNISTIAGNGTAANSGDGGPATSAGLNGPSFIAIDSSSHLFVAVTGGIREVTLSIPTTTTVTTSNSSSYWGASVTFTATVTSSSGTPTGTVSFYANGSPIGSGSLSGGSASIVNSSLAIGSYTITASYAGTGAYLSSTSPGITQTITMVPTGIPSQTITPSPATVTNSVTFSATVNASNGQTPAGTLTVQADGSTIGSNALNGSGAASVAYSGLSVGSHSISFLYSGNTDYDSSSVTGINLNILKISTSMNASDSTSSANFNQCITFSATVTAAQNQSAMTGTVTFTANAIGLGSAAVNTSGVASVSYCTLPVGLYTITASYGGAANYSTTSGNTPQQLRINQTTPSVIWGTPAAIGYGTPLSGTQLNASVSPSIPGTYVYTPAAGTVLQAGTQTLSVTFNPTDSADYTSASGSVQITVNPATLTVTPTSEVKAYGTTYSLSAYTPTGLQNGDTVTGVTLTSTGTPATAGVGSYPITASGATGTGLSNYNIVYASGSTLTVNAVTLTITPTSEAKTYGTTYTLTAFTSSGLKNSDSVSSVTLASGGAAASAGVGSYPITGSGAVGIGLGNYNIVYASGSTLTVNPAPLTITPTNVVKTYGATYTLTAFTPSGLQNSDTVTGVTLTSAGTPATAAVGGYSITASGATGSGLSNYSIAYNSGTLTVNAATLTITPASQTKPYGTAYTLTVYTPTGLQNSDTVTGVTLTSAGTPATAAIGSYPITASGATGTGLSNYNIVYASGSTLTVNAVTLTITPTSEVKTYGAIYTLTAYTSTGLKNSDTVTGVTLASAGTPATAAIGSYPITASGATGSGLSNYNIVYASGSTLTVNAATLTISPSSATKQYNTTYTLSAYTPTGLKNGDTVTGVTLTSPGTVATATVGSYVITASNAIGSGLGNYSIIYNTATLTVTKATPVITWANPSPITYGTPLSAIQLNASTPVGGGFVYAPSLGAVLTAGSQTLTVTFNPSDTTDYNLASASVTLQVNKATPTITWANPSPITYGTPLSAVQLNATGSVIGTFVYTPSQGTVLTAGTQILSVTLNPTDATDYNPATATVTIQVNPATPVIHWNQPVAITYGTPLSAVQLNATTVGGIAGTFVYAPGTGTVLPAGTQTLSVTFVPTDTNDYTSASQTTPLVVNKAATVITGSSSLTPSLFGDQVKLTYTLAPNASGVIPTGTVTLMDGTTELTTLTISNGVVGYTSSLLGAGTHAITAAYNGDSNYQ